MVILVGERFSCLVSKCCSLSFLYYVIFKGPFSLPFKLECPLNTATWTCTLLSGSFLCQCCVVAELRLSGRALLCRWAGRALLCLVGPGPPAVMAAQAEVLWSDRNHPWGKLPLSCDLHSFLSKR